VGGGGKSKNGTVHGAGGGKRMIIGGCVTWSVGLRTSGEMGKCCGCGSHWGAAADAIIAITFAITKNPFSKSGV
jgi:hypothetical protein